MATLIKAILKTEKNGRNIIFNKAKERVIKTLKTFYKLKKEDVYRLKRCNSIMRKFWS